MSFRNVSGQSGGWLSNNLYVRLQMLRWRIFGYW